MLKIFFLLMLILPVVTSCSHSPVKPVKDIDKFESSKYRAGKYFYLSNCGDFTNFYLNTDGLFINRDKQDYYCGDFLTDRGGEFVRFTDQEKEQIISKSLKLSLKQNPTVLGLLGCSGAYNREGKYYGLNRGCGITLSPYYVFNKIDTPYGGNNGFTNVINYNEDVTLYKKGLNGELTENLSAVDLIPPDVATIMIPEKEIIDTVSNLNDLERLERSRSFHEYVELQDRYLRTFYALSRNRLVTSGLATEIEADPSASTFNRLASHLTNTCLFDECQQALSGRRAKSIATDMARAEAMASENKGDKLWHAYLISNDYVDLENARANGYSSAKTYDTGSILTCASNLDAACVRLLHLTGGDVNATDNNGWSPLFQAVDGVKTRTYGNEEAYLIIRYLIENGADTKYTLNPNPRRFNTPMTAEKYLQSSGADGIQRIAEVFKDKQVIAMNAVARAGIARARMLNMDHLAFKGRLNDLEKLRGQNSFHGFSEAFLLTGDKSDFEAAQKMALLKAEKKRLEHLAVISLNDKFRLFDLKVKLNGANSKEDDTEFEKNFIFLINIANKSSSAAFAASSSMGIKKDAPFKLQNDYRITVEYSLIVKTTEYKGLSRKSTGSGFWDGVWGVVRAGTSRNVEDEIVVKREVTYDVKGSGHRSDKKIDFGTVSIASLTKALGGTMEMEKKLIDEPILNSRIVKIEQF